MKAYKILMVFTGLLIAISCKNDDDTIIVAEDSFIRAADISFLPEIEAAGTLLKNNGTTEDGLTTLKKSGCNTIRLRLWKNPDNAYSGFTEVKTMAQRAKNKGMKVWLTVHYSDTWADPSRQVKPAEWQALDFAGLQQEVNAYTQKIVDEIKPDIIQIGNETNDGFLYPEGQLSIYESQYLQLVSSAITVVRHSAPETKIMLHYAGIEGAPYYFDKVSGLDYDYIGLSFYPIWHGKSLTALQNTITTLGEEHGKKVLVAETAYPFTLGWNDWTNNIVGDDSQLISGYAASPEGQLSYLRAIKERIKNSGTGIGFCYWGAEWIAFKGDEATNGSSWENQALWDFDSNALPALEAFGRDD